MIKCSAPLIPRAECLLKMWSITKLCFHHSDEELSGNLSAGIASVEQFCDAEGINRAADEALYEAKRTGRNRVALC